MVQKYSYFLFFLFGIPIRMDDFLAGLDALQSEGCGGEKKKRLDILQLFYI